MTDPAVSEAARRADEARQSLISDIREIKSMGDKMIEKTETAIQKAPTLLGIGAACVALVGVAVIASRRSKPRFPGFPRQRSFFAEAARNAALSALGIITTRVTQHLLAAAIAEPPAAPSAAE